MKFLDDAERYGFSFSTLVLEAWSDEATFYTFKREFRDPAALCRRLEEKGIHLLLWQCPVLKVEEGFYNDQLEKDICYAKKNNLLVKNSDGSFYTIPEGHWFQYSYVPDFTNPDTRMWWMQKRQSLIDAGISGFKTDGGEFILSDDTVFFNGMSGRQMRNRYPDEYSGIRRSHAVGGTLPEKLHALCLCPDNAVAFRTCRRTVQGVHEKR